MPDFDRTLKWFYIQDEQANVTRKTAMANIRENAWSKVTAAFKNAQLAPAFA